MTTPSKQYKPPTSNINSTNKELNNPNDNYSNKKSLIKNDGKLNPHQEYTQALKGKSINNNSENIKTQNSVKSNKTNKNNLNSNSTIPMNNTLPKNPSSISIKPHYANENNKNLNSLSNFEDELTNNEIDNRSLRDDVTNVESLLLDENKLKDDYS